MILKIFDRIKS